MNFKQKALNVLCRTIYKPCSIKGINDLPCIKVDADNYYFIRNTSVNVIKINNGDNLYFRECRRHTIFSEFLKELVSEFLLFGGGVCCKIKLPKVAKQNWTKLQVQIGQSCKAMYLDSLE